VILWLKTTTIKTAINRYKQNKKKDHINNLKSKLRETKEVGLVDGVFVYTEPLSIADFAKKVGKGPAEIVKQFFNKGMMVTQNQILTEEQMGELCLEFGYDFKKETTVTKENIFDTFDTADKDEDLVKKNTCYYNYGTCWPRKKPHFLIQFGTQM
jgi:translation initiation factor IF-2